jgi:hypothetical protein
MMFTHNNSLFRRRRGESTGALALLYLATSSSHIDVAFGFSIQSTIATTTSSSTNTPSSSVLFAKRKKDSSSSDDLNRWYDSVDDNATPDGVFWEEMDRQRLFNQIGDSSSSNDQFAGAASSTPLPMNGGGGGMTAVPANPADMMMMSSNGYSAAATTTASSSESSTRPAPTMDQQKSAEATLSQYALFQVADNWLDEDLQMQMMNTDAELFPDEDDLSLEEESQRLEEQLEALEDGAGPGSGFFTDDEHDEPWDHWGQNADQEVDLDRANVLQVGEPPKGMYHTVCNRTILPSQ